MTSELKECINCFYFHLVNGGPHCTYYDKNLYSYSDRACGEYFSILATIDLVENAKKKRRRKK
jgi:hypothetical protein